MTAFENSHCSPEQAEGYLADTCSDGEPCAPSSGNPTPLLYLPPDRMKAFSRLSRYGMTFKLLTEDRGAALLTWYREGFHVRISATPEREQGLPESAAECGSTWHGSLARYDPATRSWRTHQYSLLGDLELYSETWPRWGTMRNGACWERSMPGHLTTGSESGYWRTPTAHDWKNTGHCSQLYLSDQVRPEQIKNPLKPAPTPSGMWPTATCADAFTDKLESSQQKENSMHSVNLSQAVKMWPTPICQDAKGKESSPSQAHKVNELAIAASQSVGGGSLNPDWVEKLMGWPKNWTRLGPMDGRTEHPALPPASQPEPTASKPSGTDKSHSAPHLLGQLFIPE